jgi:AcrR family transcriptional regulator
MMQDALLELLGEKSYSKITISEINKRANLSRRTFYKHFESKDELFVSLVDDILGPIFSDLSYAVSISIYGEESEKAIIMLFQRWKDNSDVFRKLRNTKCDTLLLEWFSNWFHKMYFEAVAPKIKTKNKLLAEYTSNLIAGAYFKALAYWADTGMVHPPAVMGKYLYSLLGPPNVSEMQNKFANIFNEYSTI